MEMAFDAVVQEGRLALGGVVSRKSIKNESRKKKKKE